MEAADAFVTMVLDTIVTDHGVAPGREVALLVNGLGTTPPAGTRDRHGQRSGALSERGGVVSRAYRSAR